MKIDKRKTSNNYDGATLDLKGILEVIAEFKTIERKKQYPVVGHEYEYRLRLHNGKMLFTVEKVFIVSTNSKFNTVAYLHLVVNNGLSDAIISHFKLTSRAYDHHNISYDSNTGEQLQHLYNIYKQNIEKWDDAASIIKTVNVLLRSHKCANALA